MKTGQMNIGDAVALMKSGERVCRDGWNGKGMYLAYQKGYPDGIPINQNTADATGKPVGTVLKFLPYVMMCTAQGDFVPWLCSQTDLLATDWQIANGFTKAQANPSTNMRPPTAEEIEEFSKSQHRTYKR